jgi:Reverse transcriptase (RNA-dependent DNA polymerase)
MLLLDVEKAFDLVWHKALLHKLLQWGCDIFLTRLIFSVIKVRTFQVRGGSVKLSSQNNPFGVSQGAKLSPTLYNIFTSDVSSSAFCGTATFADDTTIFASSQTPLLVQDQLQDYLNEN